MALVIEPNQKFHVEIVCKTKLIGNKVETYIQQHTEFRYRVVNGFKIIIEDVTLETMWMITPILKYHIPYI